MNPSVKEGVDTLLIYLYRALNRVDDMEYLASSQNSCVVVRVAHHFSLHFGSSGWVELSW